MSVPFFASLLALSKDGEAELRVKIESVPIFYFPPFFRVAFHTKYVILSVYKYVYSVVIYLEDADRANFIRNSLQT